MRHALPVFAAATLLMFASTATAKDVDAEDPRNEKRGWNEFGGGGYGKRSYEEEDYPYLAEDDGEYGGVDKRAWNSGFAGGMGKRAWNSGFAGGMGKRAWNSGFTGGMGKRAWNSGFTGGMGKRAWNSGFAGGMGKRAWNSGFAGGMGKRAWNSGFAGKDRPCRSLIVEGFYSYRVAHLLWERNMLTSTSKFRHWPSSQDKFTAKRNFKFGVNISFSRSRWATLYVS